MRALVVFESMFGNTEQIARAVAEGIGPHGEVRVVEVSSAPTDVTEGIELVVAGGPTHAFGMSRPSTREDATKRAAEAAQHVVSEGIGLREWLDALRVGTPAPAAAAFDTHIGKPRVPGSAARAAHRRLRKQGLRMVADAESFYVEDTAGPLQPGETDRARRWGERLATQVEPRGSGRRTS